MIELEKLLAVLPGNWERFIATVILLLAGVALSQLWARYLAREELSTEKRRQRLVWARNVIWAFTFFTVVSVWASTIAGFALSLAAVAGAMLIVSKELLMCVLGYAYLTLVRPFRIGDMIELGAVSGRVIDVDMFATTLAEFGHAGQLTGKTTGFPNGLLLTQPLKNNSATGEYIIHLFRMPLPAGAERDLERAERAATAAADHATEAWRGKAEVHFRKLSDDSFISLPSGRTKILWDFSDPKHLLIVVRVACPPMERLNVEQAVFRETWKRLSAVVEAESPAETAGPAEPVPST
ncbi:mechanosensitive ion channel family protein [Pseudothauera nasutitermitis]|nr:mechanosensitive ion channel family protein [Pseudothauera nasutitermitis]